MDHFETVAVENVKIGEYVRKIGKDGKMQSKTYKRESYNREFKVYDLADCDDCNRWVHVKKGTLLAVGFTY